MTKFDDILLLTDRGNVRAMLQFISPYPWRFEKTKGGEYWITSPDDSDHEYRSEYEPIYESSGTGTQLAIDGEFIAQAPKIIESLIDQIDMLQARLKDITNPESVCNMFTPRELRLIKNSLDYANNDPAGLPGHNLMLIIAKLMFACGVDAVGVQTTLEALEMPTE